MNKYNVVWFAGSQTVRWTLDKKPTTEGHSGVLSFKDGSGRWVMISGGYIVEEVVKGSVTTQPVISNNPPAPPAPVPHAVPGPSGTVLPPEREPEPEVTEETTDPIQEGLGS